MPQQSVGSQGEVTLLLRQWREGDQRAFERLSELVYDDLRRMARGYLAGERRDHTLQPTALVHETYLRLVDQKAMAWEDRRHFFALAATTMRRILVDHARRVHAGKRGGQSVNLDEVPLVSEARSEQFLALDEALNKLARFDARQSRVGRRRDCRPSAV